MGDLGFSSESVYGAQRSGAGTITRIRLENFMCHSSLQIELGEWVNFITGQNGSGKSAILTALCIAFGCRAKGTQRAATLKDFIKTGCSYAVVQVELKNRGEDAFKPEIYGHTIIIERRITESSSSTVLKDHQGKKVASRKQELVELTDHFNIDVENPCVIMSQDKSREFLHSGNDKDKFKFFFKATLLQQVNDLLQSIYDFLNKADALVEGLEATIRPIQKELSELQGKIRNMEHVVEITQKLQQLKKKLAWSWVYDVDRQLQEHTMKIEKFKDRIPLCQAKIDSKVSILESLRDCFTKKKAEIAVMVEKTSEVRRRKDEFQQSISLATKEKLELKDEFVRNKSYIQKMVNHIKQLEQQVQDIHEQHVKNTQAEESEIETKLKDLQHEIDAANSTLSRMKEEYNALSENLSNEKNEIKRICDELEDYDKKYREIKSYIGELQQHQTNKVTAFGGDRVINLLRAIERHHHKFKRPPIGPIGSHVTLVNGDTWAPAVEQAIGKLLNAFIVTDHKDALILRGCAREANYTYLQIIIYDFSRPRLSLPQHMLPQTKHPTTLSVLHSDNPTVVNVLVDMGNAERQVLVRDYDVGKAVAFEQRISNLKEVYTLDGHKMFSRGSVQTILPSNRRMRTGRLCSSYDEKIKCLERDALTVREEANQCRKRKRDSEERLQDLQQRLQSVKRRCTGAERNLMSKELAFQDVKNSFAADASPLSASTVDELSLEISKVQEETQEKEIFVEKLQFRMNEAEAKVKDLKLSFQSLCGSAKEEVNAFEAAEKELMEIEKNLQTSEAEKAYYENVMRNKVVADIKGAEARYQELELLRKESCRKASIICPEDEIEALGGLDGSTPEQLSAQVNRLNQRLEHESHQYSESIEDLRMLYEKKESKILRKQQTYKVFREQFQSFCQYRAKMKNKTEQEIALLKQYDQAWNVYGVLNFLQALVEKSTIIQILEREKEGLEQFTATDGYDYNGGSNVLKVLGYFSMVGLLRVHCLLGDYHTGLKCLQPIDITQQGVYTSVIGSHITTIYHYGFGNLMLRRYVDAIREFNKILLYIYKTKQYHQKSPQYEQILKKNEQMYALLAICLSLCPQVKLVEETVNSQLREKYGEKLIRMQRYDDEAFSIYDELFSYACPKFITPSAPSFAEPLVNYNQDAYRLQLKLFLYEVKQQQLLSGVRSFLKVYSSLYLSELATYMEVDEPTLRTILTTYKHKTHAVDSDRKILSNADVDFYIDDNMIHVVESKPVKQYGDYLLRQIVKLEGVINDLDKIRLD